MSLKEVEFAKSIAAAEKLLAKEPLTAPELAEKMGCSLPAAYRRLAELRRRHKRRLKIKMVRRGLRGSEAKAFFLPKD